jgi:hypothetical protein
MNWKGCGSKLSWPDLRLYPGICLEGPRKTTKNLSHDSRSPGRDLNRRPSEYEGVLTSRPRRLLLYRRVPERTRCDPTETATLMMHWLQCMVTHQPALAHFLFNRTNLLQSSAEYCVRISCNRFRYNQCKGCSRGQTSLSTVFSISAAHIVCACQCLCRGEAWR